MNETVYLNIPRLVTILIAIILYGIALFSVLRRRKKIKPRSVEGEDRPLLKYEGPERRIYSRAIIDVDLRYRLCSKGPGINIFKEGMAIDISEGGIGILIESPENLKTAAELELKLKLPLTTQFMLIKGEVIWTKELEKEKWYRHGISFTKIDPNDKKYISKYVEEGQPAE